MEKRKTIYELCSALGISVTVSHADWYDRSAELTITIPIFPGSRTQTMQIEEYIYAALLGIYQHQKRLLQTKQETSQTDSPKNPSRLARLLKRKKVNTKAKDSSV